MSTPHVALDRKALAVITAVQPRSEQELASPARVPAVLLPWSLRRLRRHGYLPANDREVER
jgi:hypothetical protein